MAGGRRQRRVLHILGWCGAESGKEVLQQLVGGFVLTLHLIHGGFDRNAEQDAVLAGDPKCFSLLCNK